jgi:DNA-binding IclR family transcriptional regulator
MECPAPGPIGACGEHPQAARTLLLAVDHGLFDELGKGPRSAAQLQKRLGLDAGVQSGVLQTLLAWGLIERDGEGEHALYLATRECTRYLDSRSPAFVRDWLHDLRQRLRSTDTGAR